MAATGGDSQVYHSCYTVSANQSAAVFHDARGGPLTGDNALPLHATSAQTSDVSTVQTYTGTVWCSCLPCHMFLRLACVDMLYFFAGNRAVIQTAQRVLSEIQPDCYEKGVLVALVMLSRPVQGSHDT